MSEETNALGFIVDRLNDVPFQMSLTMVAFDEKSPFELLEVVNEVMAKIEELGYGSFERKDWKCLVEFRLRLSTAQAKMLLECLNQVVNGRVSALPQIFADINGLHPKLYSWIKTFFILQTYCGDLLSEEFGHHKAVSYTHLTLPTKA
mgnify:CR=1 FL=1